MSRVHSSLSTVRLLFKINHLDKTYSRKKCSSNLPKVAQFALYPHTCISQINIFQDVFSKNWKLSLQLPKVDHIKINGLLTNSFKG